MERVNEGGIGPAPRFFGEVFPQNDMEAGGIVAI